MRCRWMEEDETCILDGLMCAGECENFEPLRAAVQPRPTKHIKKDKYG
jgi:hypothetical protein